ncbi:hypothetical protein T10_5728 [Trichinella papuae]|uniref:Uncharacterized protein n=1 Tax=Trichinella papuae TaxID=268474 RepID=A0A0V1MR90_9BILA|nr:hypothetical protein T10_5728 [Trichinella papuae]
MVAMCIVLDIRLLPNGPSSWSMSTSSISCILFVCQRMNLHKKKNIIGINRMRKQRDGSEN